MPQICLSANLGHMPLICRGQKYVLWPLSLVFSVDRAEGPLISGVNRAPLGEYDPHPPMHYQDITTPLPQE